MNQPSSTVKLQRIIRAPAAQVFAAWLSPADIERWMFGRGTEQVIHLQVDPQIGGRFSFLVRRAGVDFDHVGEYLELAPPRRLVFTWNVGKGRTDGSKVEIELVEHDGGVELTLVHTLPGDAAPYANLTQAGWMRMLGALARFLERRTSDSSPPAPAP